MAFGVFGGCAATGAATANSNERELRLTTLKVCEPLGFRQKYMAHFGSNFHLRTRIPWYEFFVVVRL